MHCFCCAASPAGLLGHHASPTTKLYHFVDQKMSWTDAQRYCREQFDDLATVDNPEELKQLQESRSGSDYDTDSMWIGLYDNSTRWQWSHGNQDDSGPTLSQLGDRTTRFREGRRELYNNKDYRNVE